MSPADGQERKRSVGFRIKTSDGSVQQVVFGAAPAQNAWIYAVDIGSPAKGNLAWARCLLSKPGVFDSGGFTTAGPRALEGLWGSLEADLRAGGVVALGLECPLWMPVPESTDDICKGRKVGKAPLDGNRSMFASAGACAALTGMQVMAWLFAKLKSQPASPGVTFDAKAWGADAASILIWEAFVSGKSKAAEGGHEGDAKRAAIAFASKWKDGGLDNVDLEERSVNLARLLWEAAPFEGEIGTVPQVVKP